VVIVDGGPSGRCAVSAVKLEEALARAEAAVGDLKVEASQESWERVPEELFGLVDEVLGRWRVGRAWHRFEQSGRFRSAELLGAPVVPLRVPAVGQYLEGAAFAGVGVCGTPRIVSR
jgi:hypothetical protein